ncbi:hypothetical protein GCM10010464_02760 [Pseudonocardia yunnanensis]
MNRQDVNVRTSVNGGGPAYASAATTPEATPRRYARARRRQRRRDWTNGPLARTYRTNGPLVRGGAGWGERRG